MHSFLIRKDSWHYRWLCFYNSSLREVYRDYGGGDPVRWFEAHCLRPGDFCQYWRMVLLWPSIRIALHLILYGLAVLFAWNSAAAAVMSVGMFLAGIAIVGVLGIIALGLLFALHHGLHRAVSKASETSFISTAHAAYKGKFCPTLDYTSGDD